MEWEEDNADFTCGLCNKLETDQHKLLICMYCFAAVHLECKGIRGMAVVLGKILTSAQQNVPKYTKKLLKCNKMINLFFHQSVIN